ncbi:MAG: type III secretion system chaperone [Prosthecobacter sp.]
MKFQTLLAELGGSIGLGSLQPDESGACRLVFNGQVSIDLETDNESGQNLIMHAVVGRLPPEERRSFCLTLLGGNYLSHSTKGAVLGLDPTTEEIVLHRRLPMQTCDTETLADELVTLVTTAQKWITRLSTRHERSVEAMPAPMAGMIRV